MSLKQLIIEIHRRSLWQTLTIYLGASWAVLEVTECEVHLEGLTRSRGIIGEAIGEVLGSGPVHVEYRARENNAEQTAPEVPQRLNKKKEQEERKQEEKK